MFEALNSPEVVTAILGLLVTNVLFQWRLSRKAHENRILLALLIRNSDIEEDSIPVSINP